MNRIECECLGMKIRQEILFKYFSKSPKEHKKHLPFLSLALMETISRECNERAKLKREIEMQQDKDRYKYEDLRNEGARNRRQIKVDSLAVLRLLDESACSWYTDLLELLAFSDPWTFEIVKQVCYICFNWLLSLIMVLLLSYHLLSKVHFFPFSGLVF